MIWHFIITHPFNICNYCFPSLVTTTAMDVAVRSALADRLGMTDEYLSTVFAGMDRAAHDISGMSDREIFLANYKRYRIEGLAIGIGSIDGDPSVPAEEFLDRMLRIMPETMDEQGEDMIFAKVDIGTGTYILSIAVRILSFADDMPAGGPDTAFWKERLQRCLDARRTFALAGSATTSCYRLVHGEGDGLPGLVIDWYDGVCVMQAHSAGMFLSRKDIAAALREIYGDSLLAGNM